MLLDIQAHTGTICHLPKWYMSLKCQRRNKPNESLARSKGAERRSLTTVSRQLMKTMLILTQLQQQGYRAASWHRVVSMLTLANYSPANLMGWHLSQQNHWIYWTRCCNKKNIYFYIKSIQVYTFFLLKTNKQTKWSTSWWLHKLEYLHWCWCIEQTSELLLHSGNRGSWSG